MGIYLGANALGGGGGSSSSLIGTEKITVNDNDYIVLTDDINEGLDFIFSSGMHNSVWNATANKTSNVAYLAPPTDPTEHRIVTGTFQGGLQTKAENNTWQTVYNDTSGGGVFYHLYHQGFGEWEHPNDTVDSGAQLKIGIRFTIDGGTPIEIVAPNLNMNNIDSNGETATLHQAMFVGTSLFKEDQKGNNTYHFSSNTGLNRYPTLATPVNEARGIFTKAMTLNGYTDRYNVGYYKPVLIGHTGEQLRRLGVPGLKYETSLLIETLYASYNYGSSDSRGYNSFDILSSASSHVSAIQF